jgi:hypothetical protein
MKKPSEMSVEEIREELNRYEEERKEYERTTYTNRTDYERRIMLDEREEEDTIPSKVNELLMEAECEEESESWKAMNVVREVREREVLIERILQAYVRGEITDEQIEKMNQEHEEE